jgi:hypothetical protein
MEINVPRVRSLVANVVEEFQNTRYAAAIQKAQEVLRFNPHNREILAILAESHYAQGDADKFAKSAQEALEAEATLTFNLIHHHAAGGTHHALLTVSDKLISFDPKVKAPSDCRYRAFNVSLKTVVSAAAVTIFGCRVSSLAVS